MALGFFTVGPFAVRTFFSYGELSHGEVSYGEKSAHINMHVYIYIYICAGFVILGSILFWRAVLHYRGN